MFARSDLRPPFCDEYRHAALRCIVGLHRMRSAQPTRMIRTPGRTFVYMVARKSLSKCDSSLTPRNLQVDRKSFQEIGEFLRLGNKAEADALHWLALAVEYTARITDLQVDEHTVAVFDLN